MTSGDARRREGKRVSVFLPTELFVALMIHRIESGGSMSALVERICADFIAKLQSEEQQ